VAPATIILDTQEAEIRRVLARSQPWTKRSRYSISKKKHHKKELVERPPSKHDALSSNPSVAKKKKENQAFHKLTHMNLLPVQK
jgi:hypothetical protein